MNKIKFSIYSAVFFAVIGLIIGGFIAFWGEDYLFFPLYATLSGFITAFLFSYFLNVKPENFNKGRLIFSGILTGILSHWLCWYFFIIEANIKYTFFGISGFEPPMNLIEATYGVFAFCIWSWLFFGWATVLASIIINFSIKKALKY